MVINAYSTQRTGPHMLIFAHRLEASPDVPAMGSDVQTMGFSKRGKAQLIQLCQDIFSAAQLPLRLHPYKVFATSPRCGFLEVVPEAPP